MDGTRTVVQVKRCGGSRGGRERKGEGGGGRVRGGKGRKEWEERERGEWD
jgi:hypothetical protein